MRGESFPRDILASRDSVDVSETTCIRMAIRGYSDTGICRSMSVTVRTSSNVTYLRVYLELLLLENLPKSPLP